MADASLEIGNSNWAVKPSLLLGYNVGANGYSPVEMDVVRATPGTRTNALGIIDSKNSDIARIDYSSGVSSLLVEPQRTNLDANSQTFVGWTLNNSGGVTTASVIATNPYGFATVQKVIPSAVLGQHRPLVSANYSANGRIWVIAKADGYNFLSLGEGGGVNGSNIIFDLSNGTISGSQSFYTASITPLGNGWYKCSINTINTGLIIKLIVIRNNNTLADYVGDGTSGVLIAHKQLEVGEYDTSSILTNGGTVTRNADVISKTGISDLIGQTEGTFFAEFSLNTSVNFQTDIRITAGTGNEIIIFNTGLRPTVNVTSANVLIFSTGNALDNTTLGANNKIAVGYKNNDFVVYQNGVLKFSQNTGNVPLSLPDLVLSNGSRSYLLKNTVLFKTRLTNSEIAQLTTL